ncbi:MAG: hypothetical protein KAH32_07990, partial [Chlamydiia bacterium]|nr:hypothetical protein [Chlamydiia bacterium]
MIVVEEKTVSRAKRIIVSALFMAGTTALLSGCGMIKNSICECARGYNVTYAAEGHEVFLNELGDDTYSLDIFKAPGVLESTMMIYGNAVHVIEKETFEVFTDG